MNIKRSRILPAIIALLFASLACQAISSGSDPVVDSSAPSAPGLGEENQSPSGSQTDSSGSLRNEFPIPDGAMNITEAGGTLLFQVKMSLNDAADFYLTELAAMGYKERPILTVIEVSTFSMVFDGHESGNAIVVQGVDLGDGTVNISIRLEDV
ncbi:MAG: hypothetical protein Q8L64_00695 [bacterium]|nr:hypothetical protein [bacterium]